MESAPKIEICTQMYDRETGVQQFRGLVMSEIIADVRDGTNLSFHLSGMIAGHCRNLGRVGKIQMFPILQICRRPSQTIRDICDARTTTMVANSSL